MKYSSLCLKACIFVGLSLTAHADRVSFMFGPGGDAGSDFDSLSSASYTDESTGLEISGTALLAGDTNPSNTVFNQTGSYFGVNASVSPASDDTDQLDGDDGAESMVFSFNQDVTLTHIDFGAFSGSGGVGEDEVLVSISDGSSFTIFGDSYTNDTLITSEVLSTSQTLTISWIEGNGVSLEFITVDFSPAVPEPSTYAALLGLAAAGFAFIKRRRSSK